MRILKAEWSKAPQMKWIRIILFLLLAVYSIVLMWIDVQLGQNQVRGFFSDIVTGTDYLLPYRAFLGINTTLSVVMLAGISLHRRPGFAAPRRPTQQRPGNSETRLFESFLDIFLNPPAAVGETSPPEFSEPVRRALKFMRERFEAPVFKPFSLNDLSEAAHASSKHLCRVFHKELGLSPMRVYRLMQFQLAVSMLARSNRNIQDVAIRCGFSDPFYFSRSFSKIYGRSPGQLRQDMKNGAPPPPNPLPPSRSLMPRLHW